MASFWQRLCKLPSNLFAPNAQRTNNRVNHSSIEFIRKSQLQDQVERGHLTQTQADAMSDWMDQFEEFCHEMAPNQNWRLGYTNMLQRHNNHLLTME